MRLQRIRGRPVVHPAWGSLVAWIDDVLVDPCAGKAVAFILRLRDDAHRQVCIAPFSLERNPFHSHLMEADPERWHPLRREPGWIGLQALADLLVVWEDGDRSVRVTDAEWDPETGEISAYIVQRPWWRLRGLRRLTPSAVIGGSPDLLLVRQGT